MVTTCLINHREPAQAADGLHVCLRHYTQIPRWLDDILDGWAMLPMFLLPGSSADNANHRGKQVDAAAPVNLAVVSLWDRRTAPGNPLETIESWARLVREDRNLTTPTTPANLFGEISLLKAHNEWLCAQPFVDEYHAELKERRREIRLVVGEPTPVSVGRCPIVDAAGACNGRLYQDRWSYLAVACGRCGTRWEEDDLRRLGLVLGA